MNKKRYSFLKVLPIVVLMLLPGLITSCKTGQRQSEQPAIEDQEVEYNISIAAKKWAFLFYDDADFDSAYDPLADFGDQACSNENLNVMVFQDIAFNYPNIWYLNENHQYQKLKKMKEVNMGDYQTLRDFLDYAKKKCPAEKYILSFYDHGAGWQGACVDVTSSNDILTMDEIQRALTDTGGVEMVCFSAPCLMGALESAYELRNCTKVYIGSEEFSGYIWWRLTVGDICDTLKQNPGITTQELAEIIIPSIYQHSFERSYSNESLTMSAVRTDKIGEVIAAVNALSIDLLGQINESYSLVNGEYKNVLSFGNNQFLDAYDFFAKLRSSTSNAALGSNLDQAMQALADAVIAECHGGKMGNAHGLTIYFPDLSKYRYGTDYANPSYGLDFTVDTQWDEFLSAYFSMSPAAAALQDREDTTEPYIPVGDGFYPPK